MTDYCQFSMSLIPVTENATIVQIGYLKNECASGRDGITIQERYPVALRNRLSLQYISVEREGT